MSDGPLEWMLTEAEAEGLELIANWRDVISDNPAGKLHDSLVPIWWMLPFHRRTVPAGAEFSPSVEARKKSFPSYGRKHRLPVTLWDHFVGAVPCYVVLASACGLVGLIWSRVFDGAWRGQAALIGAAVGVAIGFAVWSLRRWLGGN